MNEYVNQLIGLDWIESDWYELVRKERKKKNFFPWCGWCLVLDQQQQQQAISLYTTRKNNTYSYIYIYIQSTTKDKKDINKIKRNKIERTI